MTITVIFNYLKQKHKEDTVCLSVHLIAFLLSIKGNCTLCTVTVTDSRILSVKHLPKKKTKDTRNKVQDEFD